VKTLEHQCLANIEPCSRAGDLNTACSYVDDVEEPVVLCTRRVENQFTIKMTRYPVIPRLVRQRFCPGTSSAITKEPNVFAYRASSPHCTAINCRIASFKWEWLLPLPHVCLLPPTQFNPQRPIVSLIPGAFAPQTAVVLSNFVGELSYIGLDIFETCSTLIQSLLEWPKTKTWLTVITIPAFPADPPDIRVLSAPPTLGSITTTGTVGHNLMPLAHYQL